MKISTFVLSLLFLVSVISLSFGADGILDSNGLQDLPSSMASDYDIGRLKRDLVFNKLSVGKTRLKYINEFYGEPRSVVKNTEKKITYDYNGEVKIDFKKEKFLREWKYDSFKSPVYTDDVDDLRYDLESKTKLAGDMIAYSEVRKDYEEPTEAYPTVKDGEMSIYYYGDIKLTFENVITLTKYEIKNFDESRDTEILKSKPLEPMEPLAPLKPIDSNEVVADVLEEIK